MNIKKIIGGVSAIGLSLAGLVAAGKSGFGKDLGCDFEPTLEPIGGDPAKNSMEAAPVAMEAVEVKEEETK